MVGTVPYLTFTYPGFDCESQTEVLKLQWQPKLPRKPSVWSETAERPSGVDSCPKTQTGEGFGDLGVLAIATKRAATCPLCFGKHRLQAPVDRPLLASKQFSKRLFF